jgi:hypothetical protein
MVYPLVAGAMKADVVSGPPGAELFAAGGQLADQLDKLLVVGVAARFGAEHGGDVVSCAFPIGEELAGGWVEASWRCSTPPTGSHPATRPG